MAHTENDDFFVPGSNTSGFESASDNLLQFIKHQKSLPWSELNNNLSQSARISFLVELSTELASLKGSKPLFRKKDDANEVLVNFWLSQVIAEGKLIAINNKKKSFQGISEEELSCIAKLSSNINNTKAIKEILLENYGIVLVIKPAYKAIKLDGVSTKLQDGTPIIGLSLRYARLDNFWFTLLHELSHIALHYEEMEDPIIDDFDESPETEQEIEANRLAADSIIPRHLFSKSAAVRSLSDHDLGTLAEKAGIHPILAAGMVRKKTGNYRAYAKLVASIDTREIFGVSK